MDSKKIYDEIIQMTCRKIFGTNFPTKEHSCRPAFIVNLEKTNELLEKANELLEEANNDNKMNN